MCTLQTIKFIKWAKDFKSYCALVDCVTIFQTVKSFEPILSQNPILYIVSLFGRKIFSCARVPVAARLDPGVKTMTQAHVKL